MKTALNDEQKSKCAVDEIQKKLQNVRKIAEKCQMELNEKVEELRILQEKFEDGKITWKSKLKTRIRK